MLLFGVLSNFYIYFNASRHQWSILLTKWKNLPKNIKSTSNEINTKTVLAKYIHREMKYRQEFEVSAICKQFKRNSASDEDSFLSNLPGRNGQQFRQQFLARSTSKSNYQSKFQTRCVDSSNSTLFVFCVRANIITPPKMKALCHILYSEKNLKT